MEHGQLACVYVCNSRVADTVSSVREAAPSAALPKFWSLGRWDEIVLLAKARPNYRSSIRDRKVKCCLDRKRTSVCISHHGTVPTCRTSAEKLATTPSPLWSTIVHGIKHMNIHQVIKPIRYRWNTQDEHDLLIRCAHNLIELFASSAERTRPHLCMA